MFASLRGSTVRGRYGLMASDTERVADIYSAHARGYADAWSPVIRPVALRLLEALPWTSAHRVLDVGTGSGALLADIQSYAPAASIVGVDRSPGMLSLAKAGQGTALAVMDASTLAIRDQSFDVAVMAFVLFHLQEPTPALAEARRVLRPFGVLGTVTWAEDPITRAAQVWDDELNAHGAIDPTPMPPRNDDVMNTPEKMAELFGDAGLEIVRAWVERLDHTWSVDQFVLMRTTFGTSKRKYESLSLATRLVFLEKARRVMGHLRPADFRYRAAAVCAIARRSV
jgi:ubiquinone/menaquinone biosynthesis C-methylase UbiE